MLVLLAIVICACKSEQEKTGKVVDRESVARGEKIFTENCTSCHSFQEDGIGPALGGITAVVQEEWIKKFIKDPKGVIESGDERSAVLFDRYKTFMPSFQHYTEQELSDIVAFLSIQKAPLRKDVIDPNALKDPIPAPIPMSDLVLEMEEFTKIPASSDKGQLTRICKLDARPDTKELYVVDLRGKLYEVKNKEPRVYLDITKERSNFIDKPGLATGFGSFAFHPEFAKNGLLYTTHTESPGSGVADFAYDDSIKVMLQWVLTEWQTDNPNGFPFKGKSRELFRINMVHSFHGVQEITFNPIAKKGDEDYGLLYIGIGDGSSVEFGYPFLAHSKEKIWGTVIRIDPAGRNSKNGKYGIPAGNPFMEETSENIVKEIFAYGFRNPHRITWTQNGQMLVSNVGHHNIEPLYMVLPGRDHGWPIREGSFLMDISKGMNNIYPLPADDEKYNINYPVAQYDHGEGNAISGGYEYIGTQIPELQGKYVFGDIVKGRLFYVMVEELKIGRQANIYEWQISVNGRPRLLRDLCGADKVDLRFGRDSNGEVYILTKPDGKIYKLVGKKVTALSKK
jgi:glucose/arabinose dehydrogenase/mono/diheme cytochrome c family protein